MHTILSFYFAVTLLFYSVTSQNNTSLPKVVNDTKIDVRNKEVSKTNDVTSFINSTNSSSPLHHGRERIDPSLFMEGGQIHDIAKVKELKKSASVSTTDHSLALDISAEHSVPKLSSHRRKGAPVYSPFEGSAVSHEDVIIESPKVSIQIIGVISNVTVNNNSSSSPSVPLNVTNATSTKIVPSVVASTTTSTVKPLPKKPEITVHSEDVVPPLNVIPISRTTSSSTTVIIAMSPSTSATSNMTEKSTTPLISPVLEESIDRSVYKEKQFREYFNPSPTKQPGFIIPIVISLLAVPMLGLIGYQAVRRGREAWRNRHYRRMDFLIDGMYND